MISNRLRRLSLTSLTPLIHENYIIKLLEPFYIKKAIQLSISQLQKQEPLSNAYYRSFPLVHQKRIQKWLDYLTLLAKHFSNHYLLVGCFNAEKEEEQLIGVTMLKDFNYHPHDFTGKFMGNLNFMSATIFFQQYLLSLASKKYQQILSQANLVMNLQWTVVKKNHRGKGLLPKMIKFSQILAHEYGLSYLYCCATNLKTAASLQKMNYQKIAETDVSKFSCFNVQPFEKMEEMHSHPSIWMKKLINIEEK